MDTKLTENNKDLMISILDLLKSGEEMIKCCLDKDLVLIIGMTGTGKSTLAQYLAGNTDRLHSKPNHSGTSYTILDEDDNISSNSTIWSKTLFPILVEDRNSEIIYCDCPGFSDTRSAAYDIAANYFINRVVADARRIKLVFAIHHAALEEGYERAPFMLTVEHATRFIRNLDKYKNSIALVVTKATSYNKRGRITDESIVEGIAGFLQSAIRDLETEGDTPNPQHRRAAEFIKILLAKTNEEYEKIGIFRKPEEPGRLSDLEDTLKEMTLLQRIILNNIQFIKSENSDFGYSISADSHNHVIELVDTINREVSRELIELSNEVEHYYSNKEDLDMEKWRAEFESLNEMFTRIQSQALMNRDKESQHYLKLVIDNINSIDVKFNEVHLNNINNRYRQLEFLNTVSERGHRVDTSCVAEGIASVIEFFHNSSKWYTFLCKLYLILTDYRIQKDSTFNEIAKEFVLEKENAKLSEITLNPNLKNILDDSGYNNVKDITLNQPKIKTFKHILNFILKDNVKRLNLTDGSLLLIGRFLKLSEIKFILPNDKTKSVFILALNKVFIDTDLDETGNELRLTIIAPTWEIIGEPSIVLDGRSGTAHDPPQPGSEELRGNAGHPGEAAGIFVAIGNHFINDEHLRISAVGGRGGPGQEGSRGLAGQDGRDPDVPDWEDIDTQKRKWVESGFSVRVVVSHYIPIIRLLERELVDVTGTCGTSGGTGGDGGRGGFGGPPGQVIVINTSGPQPKFIVNCKKGEEGVAGAGGAGGSGGRNGHQQRVYIHRFDISSGHRKFDREGDPVDMGRAGDGNVGGEGKSDKDLTVAPGALEVFSLKEILKIYKQLLKENLSQCIEISFIKGFYDHLENNPQVNNLI